MSSNFRFKLNSNGVMELLKSSGMQTVCQEYASRGMALAGSGYATDVHVGPRRLNVSIYPATDEARRDNLENNTLEKVRGSL